MGRDVSVKSQEDSFLSPKKLLEDSDSNTDDDQEGGASLRINEGYARRFKHNKKREELHRLEEKCKNNRRAGDEEEEQEESSDESEDEDAYLATEQLDTEISAVLTAIKNKDPRIYDKNAVFYASGNADAQTPRVKKEKPVTIRDYHVQRYMAGDAGSDDEDAAANAPPKRTYVQEQADLKTLIVSQIAAAAEDEDSESWSGDETFLKPKSMPPPSTVYAESAESAPATLTEADVALADKNPEEYISKFMASRTWTQNEHKWEAFESDDEPEDEAAERLEHAYNIRFEDPSKSQELLKTYSRNMVDAKSVRKSELTGRQRQRKLEKERKEEEKRKRVQERARLRRLQVEEASDKLARIKEVAGLSGRSVSDEDWLKFLDEAWDDSKWAEEMQKRFGDAYYNEPDRGSGEEAEKVETDNKRAKKLKKPRWDDDLDIRDLIPDLEESDPHFVLSDEEEAGAALANEENAGSEADKDERPAKKRKTRGEMEKERIASKRQARADLAKLEALVNTKMEFDNPTILAGSGVSSSKGPFRYRETSPTSFGLTAWDILLAPSDTALNEFAGLKKLASFRDPAQKRKDKKRLGKKARLMQWRKETFGDAYEHTGPTFGFGGRTTNSIKKGEDEEGGGAALASCTVHVDGESKKKRKRSKKNKGRQRGTEGGADE